MARHRKLTQKFAGFPIFKVGTSGDTFPVTSPFTTGFTGYGDGLSLDLQFAADKTLTARKGPTPVFTRASTATFVGSDGLIQSAAINAARFDHDPITGVCKGLLIEETRANLLLRSEEFNNAIWQGLVGATKTANTTVSPDGLTNADTITATSNASAVYQTPTASNSTAYTTTIYLKAGTISAVTFGLTNQNESAITYSTFTLTGAGSFTALGGSFTDRSASITSVGNGWYCCVVTGTSPASGTTAVGPMIRLSGAGTIYAWGAQLEVGSFPTSYIPTVASSVVRSQDVCSITGSAFTGFYNQSEGSFACNYSIPAGFTGNRYAASIEDTTGGPINAYTFRNTTTGINFINTGGYTSNIGAVTTTLDKHIIAYSGTSEFVYCKNGVIGSNTGSGTRDPSLLIRMGIGTLENSNGFTLSGHIQSIRYFKKRLSNAKLQALTTL